jgi:hypothetical protein
MVTLAENYRGYISLSWGQYGNLYEVLGEPQSNGDGYMVLLEADSELEAMKQAARHKYEAKRRGQVKGALDWDEVVVLLREMRRDRVEMGLDYCYWDVG